MVTVHMKSSAAKWNLPPPANRLTFQWVMITLSWSRNSARCNQLVVLLSRQAVCSVFPGIWQNNTMTQWALLLWLVDSMFSFYGSTQWVMCANVWFEPQTEVSSWVAEILHRTRKGERERERVTSALLTWSFDTQIWTEKLRKMLTVQTG